MHRQGKLTKLMVAVIAGLFVVTSTAPLVAAPAPGALGDAAVQDISQNCRQAQVQLRALQKRDTVLRINRGRLYDLTLRQTGAFVTRLHHNNIDAPAVVQADAAIRADLQRFKDDYDRYAGDLGKAINIDCAQEPREFHVLLVAATESRAQVGRDVAQLKQHINDYVGGLAQLSAQSFNSEESVSEGGGQ